MLRRTPFKRKPPARHQPTVEREPKPLARATRAATYAGAVAGIPAVKEAPARSEAYRRLVAAMPCCICGRPGTNQAAHANTGKGLALKSDDRTCFALCPPDHRRFDQSALYPRETRRQLEAEWGARTRAAILAAGTWPRDLPHWREAA